MNVGLIAVEKIGRAMQSGAGASRSPGYVPQLSEVEGYRDHSMADATEYGSAGAQPPRGRGREQGAGTVGVIEFESEGDGAGGTGQSASLRPARESGGDGEEDGYVRRAGDGHGAHGELNTLRARELVAKAAMREEQPPPPIHKQLAVHRRETTSNGGGSGGGRGGRPQLGCRLRECDQVSAPFDLSKVYRNSVTMHRAKWARGSPVKVPKFLGIEGRVTRMQRGKGAEVMHKAVKWSHLGPVSASLAACLPSKDAARAALPEEGVFATCAVVGNGGGLLLKENGAFIDSHSAVFRFNGGLVRGFEAFVGARTTFRLANFDHFAFHEDGAPAVEGAVLQHVTRPEALQKMGAWCAAGNAQRHNLTVAALDPDFHYHVLNTVARGGPSNGFYGTILAVEMCRHVTLFGFQKDWKESAGAVKYHYYDGVEPTDQQVNPKP
jgi:hypothetical protein